MKYLNNLFFLILVAAIIFLSGCRDQLNLSPHDAPSNVTFYEDEDQLLLAVNGAYEQTLWLFYGWLPSTAFEQFDLMSDIGFERSHAGVKSIADGSHGSGTGEIEATWSHFYNAIARVNNLLDNMQRAEDNVSPVLFQRVQAEARFLRAFSYFYLSELYGDVPLLTTVPETDEAQIGRTSKEEVVDQIIEDLDFAAERLPVNWSSSDQGRATKGAALALKSRVALFNDRYNLAAQAAQDVINLDVYALYSDYKTLTLYEGVKNEEVIFDIPFQIGVQTSALPRSRGSQNARVGGWSMSVPSQSLVDSYEATDGETIDRSSVYNQANPFENRDPRLDGTIVRPQAIWGDFIFESHPDSSITWVVNEVGEPVSRFENRDVTSAFSTFTGYLWRKYIDPQDIPAQVQDSEINFILMRYAEVLQIYAEARIEGGNIDQSVLDAINKVRARAYGVDHMDVSNYPAVTTMNQSELRRIIRRERKVEFAGEGLRYFDIRRWRIAEHVMNGVFLGRPDGLYSMVSIPQINPETGNPIYDGEEDLYWNVEPRQFNPNRDYLWPIPQAELDVNDAMTQNPGY